MPPKRRTRTAQEIAMNRRKNGRAAKRMYQIGRRLVGAEAKAAWDQQQRDIQASEIGRCIKLPPVPEKDQPLWVKLLLIEDSEGFVGQVAIRSEHLKSSHEYLELRECKIVEQIQLSGFSLKTLERYVQSISPKRLSHLPQYDVSIRRGRPEDEDGIALCEAIEWNFEDIVKLYSLATELQDDHVRNLILDHWREELQSGSIYKMVPSELKMLYNRYPADDFAVAFWKTMFRELSEEDLAEIDEIEIEYSEDADFNFHRAFHRCGHPRHKERKCNIYEITTTELNYTLREFEAMAKRILLSVGFEQDDNAVVEIADVLKRDLYNQYANASTIKDGSATIEDDSSA